MALLSEPKRKVKHGLDPQNMSWSNDNSKIGQRLMEKMGWEKGKGLGANESGITEHIKATYKSDTKGLGSTPQTADAWIAHQDDFNDILKMLNSQSETDAPAVEKTEKEKRIDGHKRYHGRFARGQAQTLRSIEDLDCIFGKRKNKSASEPNELSTTNPDCDESEEKRHGLTTVTSATSVQEYFAKKMAEKKARIKEDTVVDGNETASKVADVNKTENKSLYGAVNFTYNNGDDKTSSTNEIGSENRCRGWYNNFTKDNCGDLQNNITEELSTRRKKKKKEKHDNEDNIEVKTPSKKERKRNKHKTIEDSLSSEGSHKVSKSLEISHDEDKGLSNEMANNERKRNHKSSIVDAECTNATDEKGDRKKKKKSKRNQIDPEDVIVDENLISNVALMTRPNGKNKKLDNDKNTSNIEISTNKPVTDKTDACCGNNVKQKHESCDSADVTLEVNERKKKKKQKRKHSEIEESSPVETNSKMKKKRRKDSNGKEPEGDTTGVINKDNKDASLGEDGIHKDDAGNKVTTEVNHSLEMSKKRDRKRKKKERRKKKDLEKIKQDALSNNLFLGSNIADIVGYGVTEPRVSKRGGKV